MGSSPAHTLAAPLVSLDKVRYQYYQELGYDPAKAQQLRQQSFEDLIQYWQPFDAHAVVRVLAEHHGCVFDFGAIHSVYDDPALLRQVEDALRPYPHVVLLLPTGDPEESVRILHERGAAGADLDGEALEMWRRIIGRFIRHPSNYRLAKHTIYTAGQTAEETRAGVLQIL